MLFRRVAALLAGSMLSITALAVTGSPAAAAAIDLYVTTGGNDAGACSQAAPCATVQRAVDLTVTGTPTVIHVAAGWYTGKVQVLGRPTLTIRGAGPGSTVLDGGGAGTVVTLFEPSQITISDLSIVNGDGWQGGGIVSRAGLTLTRVQVTFNQADAGGGIFNLGSLTMTDSIIGYNVAELGGAIYQSGSTRVEVRHSSIQQNRTIRGGAVDLTDGRGLLHNSSVVDNHSETSPEGIAIRARGTKTRLEIVHSTIAGNRAPVGMAGASGVSLAHATDSSITGSIVAHNSGINCSVAATAGLRLRYNLVSDKTCATSQGVDGTPAPPTEGMINGVDPRLGPLTVDNGGPTPTMALLPGSPAINRIPGGDALCDGADQRHVTRRPASGWSLCDIGAYDTTLPL